MAFINTAAAVAAAALNLKFAVAKSSTAAWFETCAAIFDKERELKEPGTIRANKAQRILDEIIRWCEKNGIPCRICIVKARQVGMSTYGIAEAYHRCRKRATSLMIIGDEYEKSVKNLVNMFDLYAEKDTVPWGNEYLAPSKKFTNGSQVTTETANDARAGASGTFQFVIATEVAHWRNAKKITPEMVFKAFMSCVPDKPGTVVIVESTANGTGNHFHNTYSGGITFEELKAGKIPPGWNGFIKVFYAWHEHPDYRADNITETEALNIMRTLSKLERELIDLYNVDAAQLKWRRDKIASNQFSGNESKFEEEYPSSDTDAFRASGSMVFNHQALELMEKIAADVTPDYGEIHVAGDYGSKCEGAMFTAKDQNESWIAIYEHPTVGCSYIVSADSMTGQVTSGEDPDNHAILVWRVGYYDTFGIWRPTKLAARVSDYQEEMTERMKKGKHIAACRWQVSTMRERTAAAAAYYGGAIIAPEENGDRGQIAWFLEKGAPMVSQQVHNDKLQRMERFHGWRTTPKNRPAMIEELGRRIRHFNVMGDGIEIMDPVVLQELKTFVRLANGRTEAQSGWKDDTVLSSAIGMACIGQARTYSQPRPAAVSQLDLLRRQQQALHRTWKPAFGQFR